MTWIELGVPPGWGISKIPSNRLRPTRVWWVRCVGQAYYLETEEDAHRVAWERWACTVLGDMVWDEYAAEDAMTGAKIHVFSVHRPADGNTWASWDRYAPHTFEVRKGDGPDAFHADCSSPVLALTRLAAITYLHGPDAHEPT